MDTYLINGFYVEDGEKTQFTGILIFDGGIIRAGHIIDARLKDHLNPDLYHAKIIECGFPIRHGKRKIKVIRHVPGQLYQKKGMFKIVFWKNYGKVENFSTIYCAYSRDGIHFKGTWKNPTFSPRGKITHRGGPKGKAEFTLKKIDS